MMWEKAVHYGLLMSSKFGYENIRYEYFLFSDFDFGYTLLYIYFWIAIKQYSFYADYYL